MGEKVALAEKTKSKSNLPVKKKQQEAKKKKQEDSFERRYVSEKLSAEDVQNNNENRKESEKDSIYAKTKDFSEGISMNREESDKDKKSGKEKIGDFFGEKEIKDAQNKELGDKQGLSNSPMSKNLLEISSLEKQIRGRERYQDEKNRKIEKMDSQEKLEKARDFNILENNMKLTKMCKALANCYSKEINSGSNADKNSEYIDKKNLFEVQSFHHSNVVYGIQRKYIEETPNGLASEVYKKLNRYNNDKLQAYKGFDVVEKNLERDVDI